MNIYKSCIGKYFLLFSIIPTIIICVVLTTVSSTIINDVKIDDTNDLLKNLCEQVKYIYTDDVVLYDAAVKEDEEYASEIYNGINFSYLDSLKAETNAEISLFYMDTRIYTTIKYDDGSRYIGTKNTEVWNDFTRNHQNFFDEDYEINGKNYFVYYIPISDEDNEVIGMAFAGISRNSINSSLKRLNNTSVKLCIIMSIVIILICIIVTNRILRIQKNIMVYLDDMDKGNFSHKLPDKYLNRNDEYGIMSRHFTKMNDSLQKLIQNDTLTNLYNRRAAMKYLADYVSDANSVNGSSFSLAIGDIDFFKKVNDTYGHNCGDEVLKMVASKINTMPIEEGFAARWGGEEFLLCFKLPLDEAKAKLQDILNEIKSTVVEFDKNEVSITMTFGIVQYRAPQSIDSVITTADLFLYKGKESGRDKIVS